MYFYILFAVEIHYLLIFIILFKYFRWIDEFKTQVLGKGVTTPVFVLDINLHSFELNFMFANYFNL